jgi:hypothetical protein
LCKAKEDRIALCNEKVSLPPAYQYTGPATVLAGLFLWSAAVGTGFFGGCLIRLRLASLFAIKGRVGQHVSSQPLAGRGVHVETYSGAAASCDVGGAAEFV